MKHDRPACRRSAQIRNSAVCTLRAKHRRYERAALGFAAVKATAPLRGVGAGALWFAVYAVVPLPSGELGVRDVLVTAVGTREPIDPARFLGNRSSGKQGHALAAEAASRGAKGMIATTDDPARPGGTGARAVAIAPDVAHTRLGRAATRRRRVA